MNDLSFGDRVHVAAVARRFIGDSSGVHQSDQQAFRGRYEGRGSDWQRHDDWPGAPFGPDSGTEPPARFEIEPPFVSRPGRELDGIAGVQVRWRRFPADLSGTVVAVVERWEGSTQPGARYMEYEDPGWFSKERRLDFVEVLVDNPNLRRRAVLVLAHPDDLVVDAPLAPGLRARVSSLHVRWGLWPPRVESPADPDGPIPAWRLGVRLIAHLRVGNRRSQTSLRRSCEWGNRNPFAEMITGQASAFVNQMVGELAGQLGTPLDPPHPSDWKCLNSGETPLGDAAEKILTAIPREEAS